MQQDELTDLAALFETDETAWLEQMAQLIQDRRLDELDYENLTNFLLDMAKRDKREVMSRLTTLFVHLLKWDHQPKKRSCSWESTILSQRHELQDLLESKTLENYAEEVYSKAYSRARKQAVAETGLSEKKFPADCPYALNEILQDD